MPPDLLSDHRLLLFRHLARYQPHFILGGLCLVIGLALLAVDHLDPRAGTFWPGAVCSALSLAWAFPSLLALRRVITRVCVFENGIAWTHGGRDEFRSWEEFREFFRTERPVEVRLVFKRKEEIVFNPTLSDFFQLASLIEALVTERFMDAHRQALEREGAHFGPIVLRKAGIRVNDRDFTWAEIEEYAIYRAGIVFTPFSYDDFTGEHVSFEAIPNYLVLLRLLEEVNRKPVPAEQCIMAVGRSKGVS